MKQKKHQTLARILCRESVAGYVFISPFIIGFLVFTMIPMIASLYLSFTDYDILSSAKWIGLDNYIKMFTKDSKYIKSLKVTFFYAITSVPLKLIMALAVAMIMTKQTKVTGLYRAVYYLPSIIGGSVAVAVMWKQLFSSDGVINSLLQALGFDVTISWIGNKDTAIWVLILLAVWQFGSSMLIFLAGLKQIPKSYYEAATVDGAGPVKRFFSITLPLLTPTIFFNLVMQTINGFMVFNSGYIITGGKPLNSTLFYALYLYQKAFTDYDMGYACAMAWVLLVVISIITSIVFATSKRWVYYESER
jgi:multiple sugar transport system permease protein